MAKDMGQRYFNLSAPMALVIATMHAAVMSNCALPFAINYL